MRRLRLNYSLLSTKSVSFFLVFVATGYQFIHYSCHLNVSRDAWVKLEAQSLFSTQSHYLNRSKVKMASLEMAGTALYNIFLTHWPKNIGKLIDLSEDVGHPKRMVDVGSPLGITTLLILVFDSSKVGCSYHCCNVIIRHFSLKQKRSGAL